MSAQKDMTLNLTVGSPFKLIIIFAVPMILGNLLQQLYSFADTMIVGRLIKDADGYRVVSDAPIRGVAPGQFAVIYYPYDDERKMCIGSGEIRLLPKETL